MIIMGIDPATYELGVGVIKVAKNGRITLHDVQHISINKGQDLDERLGIIYDKVSALIKKHKPDYVGIESQYLAVNPDTFRKVCYSVGVIWVAVLLHSNAKVLILESSKWRKVALGQGGASKRDVIEQMAKKFKLDPKQYKDDDFEALGIAVAVAKLGKLKS